MTDQRARLVALAAKRNRRRLAATRGEGVRVIATMSRVVGLNVSARRHIPVPDHDSLLEWIAADR